MLLRRLCILWLEFVMAEAKLRKDKAVNSLLLAIGHSK